MTPEQVLAGRIDAYGQGGGTHLPLLAAVLAVARPGPVLEVGTGHCSAPLLSEVCHAMGRQWYVLESDPEWGEAAAGLPSACISLVQSYGHGEHPYHPAGEWAVVFVDCSPGSARLPVVRALRDRAEFIVVHDTDNAGGDVGELVEYLEAFPHVFTYQRMRPWTTVVSAVRAYPGGGR